MKVNCYYYYYHRHSPCEACLRAQKVAGSESVSIPGQTLFSSCSSDSSCERMSPGRSGTLSWGWPPCKALQRCWQAHRVRLVVVVVVVVGPHCRSAIASSSLLRPRPCYWDRPSCTSFPFQHDDDDNESVSFSCVAYILARHPIHSTGRLRNHGALSEQG